MNFMVIFSFIVSLLIVLRFFYSIFLRRISFDWEKTFWTEKKYGFSIWWNPFHHGYLQRILLIRFISKKKQETIEQDYFKRDR